MNNYPPNVTGNEPQICGSEAEDKCDWCLLSKEGSGVPLSSIPDGIVDVCGDLLCEECLAEMLSGHGIFWSDLKRIAKLELASELKSKFLAEGEL